MDNRIFETGKQFAAKVRRNLNPYKVIMYGSQVYGTPTEDSDIDVAIIFHDFEGDWHSVSTDLWSIAGDMNCMIEPILLDLKHDRSGFAEEIMKIGIEL